VWNVPIQQFRAERRKNMPVQYVHQACTARREKDFLIFLLQRGNSCTQPRSQKRNQQNDYPGLYLRSKQLGSVLSMITIFIFLGIIAFTFFILIVCLAFISCLPRQSTYERSANDRIFDRMDQENRE
jgi:hypothetical protein